MRPIALPALVIALAATLASAAAWVGSAPALSALEWRLREQWAPPLAPAVASPQVLLIVRDPASEVRFGPGPWDRAVVARAIGVLTTAGAAAIGIDVVLDRPSPPGRGGAASDALLVQAADLAGNVTSLDPGSGAPPPVSAGRRTAHLASPADPDGIVRRVPLLVETGGAPTPALGLALAAGLTGTAPEALAGSLPTDARGGLRIAFATPGALAELPFGRLLDDGGDAEALRRAADGKAVVLAVEPAGSAEPVAGGARLSAIAVQAHLLNAILTGATLREVSARWIWLDAFALAAMGAALVLGARWWLGGAGALALAAAHVAGAAVALPLARVVLPALPALLAVAVALVAAVIWRQVGTVRHVQRLEGEIGRVQGELVSVQGALVRQETAVEALEEDLEAARAAVARSTGAEEELGRAADALRGQLAEARAQEERTRRRLGELERELGGLRVHEPAPSARDGSAESALARQCAALGIVTRSPGLLALFRDLGRAAQSALPILLLGEPGTGKELFARAAHRLSPRSAGPFVAVNMAAIPPELFESELFGHVRGSFTGAVADRAGHFEAAHRGTLFLDEIGDLRLDHQAKLLRVLQDGTFHRVGGTRATMVDVRVVAATNRDLDRGVAEGWFRPDLYFRLKGVALRLPPLRERGEDLPLLAERFADEAAAGAGRAGLRLSADAMAALEEHPWPGNVRELQQCLRQAAAMADGATLTRADLRLVPPAGVGAPRVAAPAVDPEPGSDAAVLASLRAHRFDMQATARALGWDRSTVTQRLKGMGFRALVQSRGDAAAAAKTLCGDPTLTGLVETKLREYLEHLIRTVSEFGSADAALAACRRRFKNLPERHFRALEALVRERFDRQR